MSDAARPLDPERLLAEADWARRLARALVGSTHGDDVAQEALRIGLERRPAVETGGVRAWLGGVIANLARKQRERGAAREHHERRAARTIEHGGEPDAIERVEFQKRLVDAVLALDEPYRSAIALRYFDDLDPRTVAERQGVSYDAARQRIARGVALLRARFEKEDARGGRSWSALSLSLADRNVGAPIALGTGGLVMGVKVKLAACAAVLAVGGVVLWSVSSESGATSPDATPYVDVASSELAPPDASRAVDDVRAEVTRIASDVAVPATADATRTIDRERDLHGVVVDERDRPVAGARVEVRRDVQREFDSLDLARMHASELVAALTTAQDGSFAIALDPGRAYDVVATSGSFAPGRVTPAHAGERVRIELVAGALVSGRVTRRVDASPVVDAEVKLQVRPDPTGSDAVAPRVVRTDDDGRYRFAAVEPGEYWIQVHPRADAPPLWRKVDVRNGQDVVEDVVVERGHPLRGRVLDAVTKAPIADAEVGEGWTFRRSVRTDADGRFAFEGFALEGVYDVAVRARGYGGGRKTVRKPNEPFPESIEVELHPGRAIVGRVVDAEAKPVADAYVAAVGYDWGGSHDWLGARSGADGSFRIDSLTAAMHHALVVRKDGFATWQRQLSTRELSTPELQLGDVVLAPPATIRGVVVDEAGAPIARRVVSLKGLGADYLAWESKDTGSGARTYLDTRRTRADDLGRFAFTDVAAGKYQLAAVIDEQRRSKPLDLEIERAGDARDLRLVVERGFPISGRVTDERGEPLRAHVEFVQVGTPKRFAVSSGADGLFEAPGLADGTYDLTVRPEDLWRAPVGEARHAPTTVPGVRGGTSDLVVVASIADALKGVVVDASGKPIAEATVEARGIDVAGSALLRTNSRGEFTLWVARGSRHEIVVTTAGANPREERVASAQVGGEPLEIRVR